MSKPWLIVGLASIYPILMLVNVNIDEVIFLDIALPLLLSLFISISIYIILNRIIKDRQKSALLVIISLFFFFYYGHIFHGYFSGKHIGELTIGRHRFFFPLWCSAFAICMAVIIRIRSRLESSIKFLNYLFLILIFSILIPILISLYDSLKTQNNIVMDDIFIEMDSLDLNSKPDIYYIVLDGYASQDTLKDYYNYENSKFYDSLEDRGFYVADHSIANHSYTYLSLSSTLNMMYMDWLGSEDPKDKMKLREIGDSIADNKVAKLLKLNGYKYVTFDSGYSTSSRSSISDLTIFCATLSEFERTLIKTTILDPFFLYGGVRDKILCQFDSLKNIVTSGNTFIFSHIVAPHPPFVFDKNGDNVGMNSGLNPWADQNAYSEQLQFVNNKVLELIDHLKNKYNKREFIMIIQSDHGPASLGTEEMLNPSNDLIKERMRILNTYYVPKGIKKKLYKEITPVNTFRLILSELLNLDLPLLDDISYFTPIGQEKLIFYDVSGIAKYE